MTGIVQVFVNAQGVPTGASIQSASASCTQ